MSLKEARVPESVSVLANVPLVCTPLVRLRRLPVTAGVVMAVE